MPSNLVKNKAQEKMWDRAKSAASEDPRVGGTSKWRLTNFIYQKIKRAHPDKSKKS